jgi:hypothetical protein
VPVRLNLSLLAVLLAACGGGNETPPAKDAGALPISPIVSVLPAPAAAVRNPMEAPR